MKDYHIIKISCHSNCGTYFEDYLQSITVVATSKEEAIVSAKEWMKQEGWSFIYPENKWDIEDLGEVKLDVIDYCIDSDY